MPVRVRRGAVLVGLVLGAALLRLLWLRAPLEHDEAGYLLIGGQWHAGASLYGDYWVDRPPLLIAFFALGHALGGSVGLRVLGCVVAGLTVLAAYCLGRAVLKERGTPLWSAAAAAALISTPLFQVTTVNCELIAVPLVLSGAASVVRGVSTSGQARARWWVLAGVLAASACLIKQNFLDVFVFAASLTVATWVSRSADATRVRVRDLGWLCVGAGCLTVGVLAVSAVLGTTPLGLWNALVVFRLHAAGILGHTAGAVTDARMAAYPRKLLVAGAVPLLATFMLSWIGRRPTPLSFAVVCTIAWEIVAVLAGQQAWSHYLIGLTPGVVLAVTVTLDSARWIATVARLGVCYATVATLTVVMSNLTSTAAPSPNQAVGLWLRASARHGDQAVVLLGQPDILETADMGSPYAYMWSLPIRVEDPNLDILTGTLRGAHAPEWVVQNMNRRKAFAKTRVVLQQRYVSQGDVCGYRIYLRAGSSRTLAPAPRTC